MTQGVQKQELDDALLMRYPYIVHALKYSVKLRQQVGELLAIIHQDGGHHEAEVGTAQAIKDAITKLTSKDTHSDMYGSNSATSRR